MTLASRIVENMVWTLAVGRVADRTESSYMDALKHIPFPSRQVAWNMTSHLVLAVRLLREQMKDEI
jgi:hypothetical protein